MRRWNDVKDIVPFIKEELTNPETWRIFEKSCNPLYELAIFKDTTFEDPTGIVHEGCFVQQGNKNVKYYFMERTWNEQFRYRHYVDATPVWHSWLDITHLISRKTADEVYAYFREEEKLHEREMFNKLSIVVHSSKNRPIMERMLSSDIENRCVFKRPEMECREFDKYVEETVKGLIDGTITPFDERWIDLLIGELQPEKDRVFGALRNKGHVIYEITGRDEEKNKYRGISLDGINVTGWQHCN